MRGRPPKTKGGMTAVLFVRTDRWLLDELDAVAADRMAEHPGSLVSRSDVARELLTKALKSRGLHPPRDDGD